MEAYNSALQLMSDFGLECLLEEVRPHLQHRAFRAWSHTCEEAAATSRPPPKPPDECTVLPHRPRLHRFGLLLAAEAGVGDLPMEPMVLHQCQRPWTEYSCSVHIKVALPVATHCSDPPEDAETQPCSHWNVCRLLTSPFGLTGWHARAQTTAGQEFCGATAPFGPRGGGMHNRREGMKQPTL